MEEFFAKYFFNSGIDTGVVAALAVIAATAGTAVVSILCNLEHIGCCRNPFYHYNTDSLMPVFAALQGTFYGMWVGPLPGWVDNLRSAILYTGSTVALYYVFKKLLTASFGSAQTGGRV